MLSKEGVDYFIKILDENTKLTKDRIISHRTKNELISLLLKFADEHPDIRNFLQDKIDWLQADEDKTHPAEDEISLPTAQKLVSRTSTPQEKINLFKSLFVGRQDVFALRWHNAKSNKSGYSYCPQDLLGFIASKLY